jgi:uncharacterized protein with beta-barrel porin domain
MTWQQTLHEDSFPAKDFLFAIGTPFSAQDWAPQAAAKLGFASGPDLSRAAQDLNNFGLLAPEGGFLVVTVSFSAAC